MAQQLSFKIENTKVDSQKKIAALYNESLERKNCLANYYAAALFYNPGLIQDITTHLAAEIGYQKAIREMAECVLMMA